MNNQAVLQSLLDSCNKAFVLDRYQFIPYNIKLNQPWNSASLSMQYRQGLLIRLYTKQGMSITGDCAPLPEMGTENLFQAQNILYKVLNSYIDSIISEAWLEPLAQYPASRFALETAILELVSQHKKQNLAQLLNLEHSKSIVLNTMLGNLNSISLQAVKKAEEQGFKYHKFKLGIQNIETEAALLQTLLKHISPDSRIRLDCNKNWTLAQAQWFLDFINTTLNAHKHQIDGLEEPLIKYDRDNYKALQNQTSISLALDESLCKIKTLDELPVKRIILKPVLSGGIIKAWQLAQQAQSRDIEVIVSSAVETAYGLWPVTHLAAAIANNQYHGLATAHWLEDTLIKAPEIINGTISL